MKLNQILRGSTALVGFALLGACGSNGSTPSNTNAAATSASGGCPSGMVNTQFSCQPISAQCKNTGALIYNQCFGAPGSAPTAPTAPPVPACAAGMVQTNVYGCQPLAPQCNSTAAWINNQCMNASGIVPIPTPAPTMTPFPNGVVQTCSPGNLFTGTYGCQSAGTCGTNLAMYNGRCVPAVLPMQIPGCPGGYLYTGPSGCQPAATATQCSGINQAIIPNRGCVTAITPIIAPVCGVNQVYTVAGCLAPPTTPVNTQYPQYPGQYNRQNQMGLIGCVAGTMTCYPAISIRAANASNQSNSQATGNYNSNYNPQYDSSGDNDGFYSSNSPSIGF